MLVRLDVHLTSCCPQVVQQYVGFLRRVSNIAIHKLMANNAGTFRRVSNIAIQNLMASNAGTFKRVSNIAM